MIPRVVRLFCFCFCSRSDQFSLFWKADQFNWVAQKICALSKQDNLKCWSLSLVSGGTVHLFVRLIFVMESIPDACDWNIGSKWSAQS